MAKRNGTLIYESKLLRVRFYSDTGEVHIEDVAAPMMSDCVLVFPFREVLKMARAAVKVLGKNDAAK